MISNIYRKLTIFIGALFLATISFSQTIRGIVRDEITLQPLPGANIVIKNLNPSIGTASDINGRFSITNLNPGRYDIQISFLGFDTQFLKQVLLQSGKETFLTVDLQESIITMEDVTFTATIDKNKALNKMATVSARAFSVEETERYAASINDPSRMALSYAGVSGASDMGNHIVIRGNTPTGILWRIEGIEIPNPNHFSTGEGSSGGAISIISSEVLSNSDFYTGAFPAEYGNATSGVFDLQLRKGNSFKPEYSVQLGLLGVQLSAEGPISKKNNSSYLVNYRYSSLYLMEKTDFVNFEENVIPSYQDLSFNVNFGSMKNHSLNIWGIGGMNLAHYGATADSSDWITSDDRKQWGQRESVSAIGISHRYSLKNKKTYIKTVAAFSLEEHEQWEDTLDNSYEPIEIKNESFMYPKVRLSPMVNHKFNQHVTLRTGLIVSGLFYQMESIKLNKETNVYDTTLYDDGSTMLTQCYFQMQHKTKGRFEFNYGGHFTKLLLNNNVAIEPRGSMKYSASEHHIFAFGAGIHSKVSPVSHYLVKDTLDSGDVYYPNKNVEFAKSIQIVASYDWNIIENIRLKTEIYYQYIYNVPVIADSISMSFSSLNYEGGYSNAKYYNRGKGLNYGLELTLEKFLSNSYYFLITASIFESKYRGTDGVLRDTRFNSKYVYNVLAGKEFYIGNTKQNILFTNVRGMLRGGYRYTPYIIYREDDGTLGAKTDDSRAYSEKVPDYWRADLSIGFRKNKPKYNWSISLDIQNVTNHKNIYQYTWDDEAQEIGEIYMLGIMPVINFKIQF